MRINKERGRRAQRAGQHKNAGPPAATRGVLGSKI
jgi:hypothetical protein